jgi:hypothetical protein
MARPNSLTTIIREKISDWITPMPKPGFSWCIGCRFNGGETWEMLDSVILNHVRTHAAGETIHIVSLTLTNLQNSSNVIMTERDQGDEFF